MHYMTLINRTAAQEDGSSEWMDRLFEIEFAFIIWSYIECGSMYWMLCKTNQYHPNLTILLKHLVGQYFLSMAARVAQMVYMYRLEDDSWLRDDTFFTICTLTRNCCTFIAFYFAPFAMIERMFATYYLHDYERNQRLYIGYALVAIMHICCFSSAIVFILEVVPVQVHVASFVTCNILSFIICLINARVNHKKFIESDYISRRATTYSLSERYQVVENIKTAHESSRLFVRGIAFIIVFSIACSSFISAEIFRQDPTTANWMHVGFNFTAILYGVGLPAAMYYYNDQWQAELVRLFRLFKSTNCCCCFYSHENLPTRSQAPRNAVGNILSTRGVNMVPASKDAERDIYFNQLHKEWGCRDEKPKKQTVGTRYACV